MRLPTISPTRRPRQPAPFSGGLRVAALGGGTGLPSVPAHLASVIRGQGSVPITVGARDMTMMRDLGVEPLGAPLASEGPVGRIRHHPGRLAAAIAASAGFGRDRWSAQWRLS